MAKMQAKIQVWQAKTNLNCQTENKMAGEIYWTGVVSFSSPLTMPLYLLFLPVNQSSLMKRILLKRNSFDCKTLHKTHEVTYSITHKVTQARLQVHWLTVFSCSLPGMQFGPFEQAGEGTGSTL